MFLALTLVLIGLQAGRQKKTNKMPGYGPAIAGNFADVAMKHFCAAE